MQKEENARADSQGHGKSVCCMLWISRLQKYVKLAKKCA